jgi:rhodanese-related sulfurtransferase
MTTRFTRSIRAEALVLALACALWLGCRADTTGLGTLTVEEVNARLAAGTDVVLCDANSADTRTKLGVVAGAQLLSSYRDYDVASELPADKARTLVFYCHSAFCSAAADAARRAVAAGHEEVFVMPDGIKGWVEARLPVVRFHAS